MSQSKEQIYQATSNTGSPKDIVHREPPDTKSPDGPQPDRNGIRSTISTLTTLVYSAISKEKTSDLKRLGRITDELLSALKRFEKEAYEENTKLDMYQAMFDTEELRELLPFGTETLEDTWKGTPVFERIFKPAYLNDLIQSNKIAFLLGKHLAELHDDIPCNNTFLAYCVLDCATQENVTEDHLRPGLHLHEHAYNQCKATLTEHDIVIAWLEGFSYGEERWTWIPNLLETLFVHKGNELYTTWSLSYSRQGTFLRALSFRAQATAQSIPWRIGAALPVITERNKPVIWHLRNDPLWEWRFARDWSTLLQLNMKFIKESAEGKDVVSLYHGAPLEPETTKLIPSLLRLHDYGLFTMGSQPAEETVIEREGKWFQLSQIPYLDFVVPFRGRAEDFLRDLVADEQLKCTITDFRSDTPSIFSGSGCDIVVTREKVECESRESLKQAEWQNNTFISSKPVVYEDLLLDQTGFSDPVALCRITTLDDVDLFARIESHAARYKHVFFPKLTLGLESV